MTVSFDVSHYSHIGARGSQQDAYLYSGDAEKGFAIVCDGMGGHRGGAEAAKAAVVAVSRALENQTLFYGSRLISQAIDAPSDSPLPYDAGTTVVGAAWERSGSSLFVRFFSVGDSYGILLNKSGIAYSTPVEGHGNILTNYWNGSHKNRLRVSPALTFKKKGVILLASDGLEPVMGNLPEVLRGGAFPPPQNDDALAFQKAAFSGASASVFDLVTRAVSKGGNVADNTTLVRIEFNFHQ